MQNAIGAVSNENRAGLGDRVGDSGRAFTAAFCPLYCSDCIVEIAVFGRMDLSIGSL